MEQTSLKPFSFLKPNHVIKRRTPFSPFSTLSSPSSNLSQHLFVDLIGDSYDPFSVISNEEIASITIKLNERKQVNFPSKHQIQLSCKTLHIQILDEYSLLHWTNNCQFSCSNLNDLILTINYQSVLSTFYWSDYSDLCQVFSIKNEISIELNTNCAIGNYRNTTSTGKIPAKELKILRMKDQWFTLSERLFWGEPSSLHELSWSNWKINFNTYLHVLLKYINDKQVRVLHWKDIFFELISDTTQEEESIKYFFLIDLMGCLRLNYQKDVDLCIREFSLINTKWFYLDKDGIANIARNTNWLIHVDEGSIIPAHDTPETFNAINIITELSNYNNNYAIKLDFAKEVPDNTNSVSRNENPEDVDMSGNIPNNARDNEHRFYDFHVLPWVNVSISNWETKRNLNLNYNLIQHWTFDSCDIPAMNAIIKQCTLKSLKFKNIIATHKGLDTQINVIRKPGNDWESLTMVNSNLVWNVDMSSCKKMKLCSNFVEELILIKQGLSSELMQAQIREYLTGIHQVETLIVSDYWWLYLIRHDKPVTVDALVIMGSKFSFKSLINKIQCRTLKLVNCAIQDLPTEELDGVEVTIDYITFVNYVYVQEKDKTRTFESLMIEWNKAKDKGKVNEDINNIRKKLESIKGKVWVCYKNKQQKQSIVMLSKLLSMKDDDLITGFEENFNLWFLYPNGTSVLSEQGGEVKGSEVQQEIVGFNKYYLN